MPDKSNKTPEKQKRKAAANDQRTPAKKKAVNGCMKLTVTETTDSKDPNRFWLQFTLNPVKNFRVMPTIKPFIASVKAKKIQAATGKQLVWLVGAGARAVCPVTY